MLFPWLNGWAAGPWQRPGLCSSCPAKELGPGTTASQSSLTQISHLPFLPNTPEKTRKDSLLESGA